MSALISVIIPAYNHEHYVQQTIRSIIVQSYDNIELIVIDDGSKDKTWEKIQELRNECEARFQRVVFLTQPNMGTCGTLNRLMDLAKGDYVFLIASDDIALPMVLETELNALEADPQCVLAVGDNAFIDSQGRVCFWDLRQCCIYEKNKAAFLTFGDAIEDTLPFTLDSDEFGRYRNLNHVNHIPNGYLIRGSTLRQIERFTEETPLEDLWLMMQLAKFGSMKYLPQVLCQYRWHSNNHASQRKHMRHMTAQTIRHEDKYCIQNISPDWLPDVRRYILTSKGPLFRLRRKLEERSARRLKGGKFPIPLNSCRWLERVLLKVLRHITGKNFLLCYPYFARNFGTKTE